MDDELKAAAERLCGRMKDVYIDTTPGDMESSEHSRWVTIAHKILSDGHLLARPLLDRQKDFDTPLDPGGVS